jgi:tryptophan 2,3-dioxygenase
MAAKSKAQTGNGSDPVTYWDYIQLDKLLSLQHPVTDAHDELQFIIVHQTFELWFRLAIYELRAAIEQLRTGDISGAIRLLGRVSEILRTACQGFDPLVTMSQQGYLEFRDALKPASGFQSMQFRIIENLIGIEKESGDEEEGDKYYWQNAVQTGTTYDHFAEKYFAEIEENYRAFGNDNIRRMMQRLVEDATKKEGVEAYREVLNNRNSWSDLYALTQCARDLQQALLDFRLAHHKVTVFTIGKHAAGTSDSHAEQHPSCAEYLLNVIRDRSTIFPELEQASVD